MMVIISPKLTKKPVIYFHFLRIVNMKRTPPTHTDTTFVSCSQWSRALPLILGIGFHAWQCDRNETSSYRNGILPANSSPNPSLCRPGHQERPSPKEMDLQKHKKKHKKKTLLAILNMSLAGKSTMKVDVFCFLKKSEIHCYTRAFDTSITILMMGEMNGLSFRKENYPATVHFHNFSEKGNVVQCDSHIGWYRCS